MLLAPAARFRLLSRSLLHIAPCSDMCLSDAQSLQMFGQLRVLVNSQDFLKPSLVTLRLGESIAEENAAAWDRALAHRLMGNATPAAALEQTTVGDTLDENFMATLAALYVRELTLLGLR